MDKIPDRIVDFLREETSNPDNDADTLTRMCLICFLILEEKINKILEKLEGAK